MLSAMQAHTSPSTTRLELHFRHDDPYSHPAFGDLRPSNSFLLKISKIKSHQDEVNLCADIVARVPEAYHFDGYNCPPSTYEFSLQFLN